MDTAIRAQSCRRLTDILEPAIAFLLLAALDDALTALATADPRRSRVVELRFFGGLSVEETAQVLDVSPETVMRDWKVAKAWLFTQLSPAMPPRRSVVPG
jgi:RNA polymerase sigma factor (sigma-70 family)